MLLAIDVGNTNLVLALGRVGDGISDVWRIRTDAISDAGTCGALMRATLGPALDDATDAIVASVVPDVTPHVVDALGSLTGKPPLVVGAPGVELGIDVNIDRPEQAGADRLVNAVGAKAHHTLPAIVLDFGTATTLDLVAADGAYEGGVIAPGVALSIESLERAAAQLPRLELRTFEADLPILGKNTVAAMESGVFWGYVSMIDGLLSRLRAAHAGPDYKMRAIMTGGLAGLFADHLAGPVIVDADLTVKGLFEIFARNR
jgi:type III pantothenate kinase